MITTCSAKLSSQVKSLILQAVASDDAKTTEQKNILTKAAKKNYLNGFEFSILIQNLLISETGYVIDTGNWENVNAEVALRLVENIKKHPILWKLFFMVA